MANDVNTDDQITIADADLPRTIDYREPPEREQTRKAIAIGLVVIVAFIVVVAMSGTILFSFCVPSPDGKACVPMRDATLLKDIVGMLLPTVIGVLGAVTGFYFGSKAGVK
ncbi:MAG: hypothetical protein K8S25_16750 [Alphaproteobacteria bacterium]|nr:hypothetical protein [Alphaproteobacteria bacterium]